jgi:hypothetical protein
LTTTAATLRAGVGFDRPVHDIERPAKVDPLTGLADQFAKIPFGVPFQIAQMWLYQFVDNDDAFPLLLLIGIE